jgi:hypothetical protein
MKQKLKPWLYALVLLLLHSSCEKRASNACGALDTFKYIKTIRNAPADFYQGYFVVLENGESPRICPSQDGILDAYADTYVLNQAKQPLKYRVWGRLFNCDSCPTQNIGTVPTIVIDKIEKIN